MVFRHSPLFSKNDIPEKIILMKTDTFNWTCKQTWRKSAKNTMWCVIGCAIGDFGTILFFN